LLLLWDDNDGHASSTIERNDDNVHVEGLLPASATMHNKRRSSLFLVVFVVEVVDEVLRDRKLMDRLEDLRLLPQLHACGDRDKMDGRANGKHQ
jgi:hypothetical protein